MKLKHPWDANICTCLSGGNFKPVGKNRLTSLQRSDEANTDQCVSSLNMILYLHNPGGASSTTSLLQKYSPLNSLFGWFEPAECVPLSPCRTVWHTGFCFLHLKCKKCFFSSSLWEAHKKKKKKTVRTLMSVPSPCSPLMFHPLQGGYRRHRAASMFRQLDQHRLGLRKLSLSFLGQALQKKTRPCTDMMLPPRVTSMSLRPCVSHSNETNPAAEHRAVHR